MTASIAHQDDWFRTIAESCKLPACEVHNLHKLGFIVLPDVVSSDELKRLADAYDSEVAAAAPEDVAIGSSTTRVNDFVNRSPEFDRLYVLQPILEASCRIIAQPFKLSTMLARTLRPRSPAQALHVDFKRDDKGWPMVGFIVMIDEFRRDNGATRFVPGSHQRIDSPPDVMKDLTSTYRDQVLACGSAGSVIVYNGSVWHGHTANESAVPRRSIQGAFIRRDAQAAMNHRIRIRVETLGRISDLAKYLLDLELNDFQRP